MKNPLVLIVAPEQKAEKLLAALSSDFDGVMAYSVQEALGLYQKNYLKIRIVIIDLVLPDASGLFLLQEFRKIPGLSEVIVCADKTDIHTAVDVMKHGVFDFLLHPISKETLQDSLLSIIQNTDFISRFEHIERYPFLKYLERNEKFSAVEMILSERLALEKKMSPQDFLSVIPDAGHDFTQENAKGDKKRFYELVYARFEEKAKQAPDSMVLVVEDDPNYSELIQDVLSGQYHVVVAPDGATALKMCEKYPMIGCILLDLVLPDTSGVHLIADLKRRIPDVEIIAVTGFSSFELAVDVMKAGASDFLQKPALNSVIVTSVEQSFFRRNKKYVLPLVQKGLIETKLSSSDKILFLQQLCKARKEHGEMVFMDDLYSLFPELKNTCIPGGVTVPGHLHDNLNEFILNLKARLSNYQTR